MKSEYTVTGMHCASCVMNVEEAVHDLPGVSDVIASFKSGTVVVDHDDTTADETIRAAITEAGYQPA